MFGNVNGFGSKKEEKTDYYSFTNYNTPSSIYKLNIETGESELYWKPSIEFNSDDYESNQVFFTSKDGTKVPMIMTHKKGIELNGKNPTILYGYGGFNISLNPSFSITNAVWMEQGGILAVPNLRGGGEYGKAWHDAGTKLQKQNVFDDFIAAGEYLIENKLYLFRLFSNKRRFKWWFISWSNDDPTSRFSQSSFTGGWRTRHATLPYLYCWCWLGL